jgi:hypothetical protein
MRLVDAAASVDQERSQGDVTGEVIAFDKPRTQAEPDDRCDDDADDWYDDASYGASVGAW